MTDTQMQQYLEDEKHEVFDILNSEIRRLSIIIAGLRLRLFLYDVVAFSL